MSRMQTARKSTIKSVVIDPSKPLDLVSSRYLLVDTSSLPNAGRGLFLHDAPLIPRGTWLGEYKGTVLSNTQEEALLQIPQHPFLFSLFMGGTTPHNDENKPSCVDASSTDDSNVIKFINSLTAAQVAERLETTGSAFNCEFVLCGDRIFARSTEDLQGTVELLASYGARGTDLISGAYATAKEPTGNLCESMDAAEASTSV